MKDMLARIQGGYAMEIKVLLCNCKGLCDSFKDSDMNKLPFEVESDLDVKYTVLSPQLCGQGGNAILEEAMKTAAPDTYLLVGACAPNAQEKLFKKLIRATGFNEQHFVPVDIRGTDNQGILDRLREAVEGILKPTESAPNAAT
jgi:heterodisulfide reductase subunit A-like polyferredoxin